MNQNQPAVPKYLSRLRLVHSMAVRKILIYGLIISTATLPQSLRAEVVLLNDAFNDPNNNISLNTNGIGDGFTAFIAGNSAPGGYLRETNGQVQFSSAPSGACRANIVSKDSIPLNVNTGLTTVQWNGLHFANQPLNRARPNCDRVFLGLVNTNTAGDWYHQLGAAHLPAGFYIQIMSDSMVNTNNNGATGNGGWSNGTNALFYTDTFGYRRELAIWKFDRLYWGQGAVSNYAPTLNFKLAVSPTTWAVSVTGDTMNGGAAISFNGTYAQSGLTNIASGGTNTVDLYSLGLSPHVLLWDQAEGPGIIMTCSNVVVTENELASMGRAGDEYAGVPYGGQPRQIPGIIQAEHYDVAPTNTDGITFHYNRPARKAAFRSTGDCIGLTRYGNGHVTIAGAPEDPDQVYLGYTHAGEWVKYSVHVAEPGTYQFGGKFASAFTNAIISVTFTPEIKTGPITIPTTAGYRPGVEVYHVWEILDDLAEIKLPAGDLVMTVKIESENAGGMNIDYLSFTKKP